MILLEPGGQFVRFTPLNLEIILTTTTGPSLPPSSLSWSTIQTHLFK